MTKEDIEKHNNTEEESVASPESEITFTIPGQIDDGSFSFDLPIVIKRYELFSIIDDNKEALGAKKESVKPVISIVVTILISLSGLFYQYPQYPDLLSFIMNPFIVILILVLVGVTIHFFRILYRNRNLETISVRELMDIIMKKSTIIKVQGKKYE